MIWPCPERINEIEDHGVCNPPPGYGWGFSYFFAAKFGSNATAGEYKTNVTLSVAAGAKETAISWDNLVYMQDMTPEVCSQAPLNTQKTLTDIRDGNTYTVARIQNKTNTSSLCWMTQNLRLVGDKFLTSDDTDITGLFFLPASSYLASDDNPKQFSANDQYRVKVYYNNNTNYGAYYNWYTATAGSGDTTVTTSGTSVEYSICPKGWRLPTGGNNVGEFYQLLNGFTKGDEIMVAPYNLVYGGYVGSSTLNYTSREGRYWSATANNSSNAYYLYFNSSGVNPSNVSNRYYGSSVRCVAR